MKQGLRMKVARLFEAKDSQLVCCLLGAPPKVHLLTKTVSVTKTEAVPPSKGFPAKHAVLDDQ